MTTSRCRSCNAPIEWARTERGAQMPIDAINADTRKVLVLGDDSVARFVHERISHWATCPHASEWRRKKGLNR